MNTNLFCNKKNICKLLNCTNDNKCCSSIHWKYNYLYGGGEIKWKFLQHNGPLFPPEYQSHNIPIIIDSKKYILPNNSEEYATIYSKYLDTEYIKSNIFKKNFWKDFKLTLPQNILLKVKSIDDIDFSLIYDYLMKEKENKKMLSKEEKEIIKKQQDEYEKPYKYCIIDGIQQNVSNYKIEPPSIFLGRGNHPKTGTIKKRIYPEDVIINLSKDAIIPDPNLQNHTWGKIINDTSVIWLASWKDTIKKKNKYIFTSFDSYFKSKSDEEKFNLAKKLKKKINIIRETYYNEFNNPDIKKRQLATALYLIDNLALRVGNSKDTKEDSDTVGVTSLRVEHINFLDNNIIKLDFLGKDSIRYCKKISLHSNVYENLKIMCSNKNKKDEIFDRITPNSLNEYLNSFLKGLTSKVWRTYNASFEFQKELNKIKEDKLINMEESEKLNYLIAMFIQANTSIALLCNHQKNVKNTNNNTINKLKIRLKELIKKKKIYKGDKLKKLINNINLLKIKINTKQKMSNVSNETSKNNYIDPRIMFAFIKKFKIPPEKILSQKSIKRFEWASSVDEKYKF